mmetsp:Transcript_35137/g.108872  ORF Transcript_35137/g.108872 Transcript_35137/m.108872 type:complete len:300 (-) Transcript_35137:1468-2367(-)
MLRHQSRGPLGVAGDGVGVLRGSGEGGHGAHVEHAAAEQDLHHLLRHRGAGAGPAARRAGPGRRRTAKEEEEEVRPGRPRRLADRRVRRALHHGRRGPRQRVGGVSDARPEGAGTSVRAAHGRRGDVLPRRAEARVGARQAHPGGVARREVRPRERGGPRRLPAHGARGHRGRHGAGVRGVVRAEALVAEEEVALEEGRHRADLRGLRRRRLEHHEQRGEVRRLRQGVPSAVLGRARAQSRAGLDQKEPAVAVRGLFEMLGLRADAASAGPRQQGQEGEDRRGRAGADGESVSRLRGRV